MDHSARAGGWTEKHKDRIPVGADCHRAHPIGGRARSGAPAACSSEVSSARPGAAARSRRSGLCSLHPFAFLHAILTNVPASSFLPFCSFFVVLFCITLFSCFALPSPATRAHTHATDRYLASVLSKSASVNTRKEVTSPWDGPSSRGRGRHGRGRQRLSADGREARQKSAARSGPNVLLLCQDWEGSSAAGAAPTERSVLKDLECPESICDIEEHGDCVRRSIRVIYGRRKGARS